MFPIETTGGGARPPEPRRIIEPTKTLRDEIAINVMHSMLDKNAALFKDEHYLANRSYRIADAMLAARGARSATGT
ncbi:hypothetical protein A4U53_030665 [Rhizobium ruizarguesonis]|uniref:Uncharacterized protein n=2 Tax=Rhizobium TaxID=379 RepID=A0A179BTR2_RHILE|nr:hypothetical protein [Rhizobium leguminosarum]OAP95072.1 hypothetical protein A4U53_17765 [Rhizobium leguminosarum]